MRTNPLLLVVGSVGAMNEIYIDISNRDAFLGGNITSIYFENSTLIASWEIQHSDMISHPVLELQCPNPKGKFASYMDFDAISDGGIP